MNIAIVAHDSRKKELLEWVKFNDSVLREHNLFCTGTTGKLVEETINGPDQLYDRKYVTCLKSGPCGGDSEISAMIANEKIDILIFFCDNLVTQGHQTDISALSRLASLYNIAFATNRTTADYILSSPLFMDKDYKPIKPDFNNYLNRDLKF